ncbi:hypothetical protein EBU95_08970 [bacterium]|nr:hypothetical protein [bacterium]
MYKKVAFSLLVLISSDSLYSAAAAAPGEQPDPEEILRPVMPQEIPQRTKQKLKETIQALKALGKFMKNGNSQEISQLSVKDKQIIERWIKQAAFPGKFSLPVGVPHPFAYIDQVPGYRATRELIKAGVNLDPRFQDYRHTIPTGQTDLSFAHLDLSDLKGIKDLQPQETGEVNALSFEGNLLTEIEKLQFTCFGALTKLNVSNGRIANINPEAFTGLGRLEVLDLSNNQISNLPNGVFRELGKLQILKLQRNRLQELPGSVLEGLGSLEQLDIRWNLLNEEQHLKIKAVLAGIAPRCKLLMSNINERAFDSSDEEDWAF